jgi:hypothetical protein
MDPNKRIHLDNLIKNYEPEETTNDIRRLKHSSKIRDDIKTLVNLKNEYSRLQKTNNAQFMQMARSRGKFLYDTYTNLFNRFMKDELDINILESFLQILKRIEECEIDQHEGSVYVGEILKRLYVDSVVKQDEKIKNKDKEKSKKPKQYKNKIKMSWKDYRDNILNSETNNNNN